MSNDKKTLELDKYECGVIFHSLKDKRNQMIGEDQPTDVVDDVLLKVIALMEEPEKTPKEKGRKERRHHEER